MELLEDLVKRYIPLCSMGKIIYLLEFHLSHSLYNLRGGEVGVFVLSQKG
jgi:hypothetical protein